MRLARILNLAESISLVLLLESAREQWVINNMGTRLSQAAGSEDVESIVRQLRAMDPTKNAQYLQRIARQFIANQIDLNSGSEVTNALQGFHQYKARLQERDINKLDFNTLSQQIEDINAGTGDVATVDNPYSNVENVKYLYKGPLGILAIPQTEAASCELGRGTQWCTASSNYNQFDKYTE